MLGWSVSSVTVSTTGLWNLNLAYQIHLIHGKLGLDSAERTQCITPHSSALFMFLDLSFHHVLWFMCLLRPKEKVLSPTLKTVMCILNFTNPNISIENNSIILLSTCSHGVKIESWKFTAVDRLQQKRVQCIIFVNYNCSCNNCTKSKTVFRRVWIDVSSWESFHESQLGK